MPRKPKSEEISTLDNLQAEDILIDGNFFKGNENLLRGKAQLKWTPEMLEEIVICKKKVLHFAEEYFYIITEDGKEKINLYNFVFSLIFCVLLCSPYFHFLFIYFTYTTVYVYIYMVNHLYTVYLVYIYILLYINTRYT